MIYELLRHYRFEAAHQLPRVANGHRCARLHGHTYGVEIVIKGPLDDSTGWVMDYSEIDQVVEPVLDQLDHQFLNEIEGLENPTSEHVVRWLWGKLADELPHLAAVRVSENSDSMCTYRGEDR